MFREGHKPLISCRPRQLEKKKGREEREERFLKRRSGRRKTKKEKCRAPAAGPACTESLKEKLKKI